MPDFRFYDAGCEPTRGPKAAIVLARKAWCRLMRPMLRHQEAIYHGFQRQIDEVTDRVAMDTAFGWDYVALVRRLAVLEDQVEALHQKLGTADRPQEWRVSIPLHRGGGDEPGGDPGLTGAAG